MPHLVGRKVSGQRLADEQLLTEAALAVLREHIASACGSISGSCSQSGSPSVTTSTSHTRSGTASLLAQARRLHGRTPLPLEVIDLGA